MCHPTLDAALHYATERYGSPCSVVQYQGQFKIVEALAAPHWRTLGTEVARVEYVPMVTVLAAAAAEPAPTLSSLRGIASLPDGETSESVVAKSRQCWAADQAERLCEDCPPVGYPTERTRCAPCPRRLEQPR